MSAVGPNLGRDSGLDEKCGCGRFTEFGFQHVLLLEHGAEACSDTLGPVRDLAVTTDLETRQFEKRPIVGDGVVPETQPGDTFGIKLERYERKMSTLAEDSATSANDLDLSGTYWSASTLIVASAEADSSPVASKVP